MSVTEDLIAADAYMTETSKFVPKQILFVKEDFVLALGLSPSDMKARIAMRYHSMENNGFPKAGQKPVWFILPKGIVQSENIECPNLMKSINLTFTRVLNELKIGSIIMSNMDTYVNISEPMEGGNIPPSIQCLRLIDGSEHTVKRSSIDLVQWKPDTALTLFLSTIGKSSVWYGPEGQIFRLTRLEDDGVLYKKTRLISNFMNPHPYLDIDNDTLVCSINEVNGSILMLSSEEQLTPDNIFGMLSGVEVPQQEKCERIEIGNTNSMFYYLPDSHTKI